MTKGYKIGAVEYLNTKPLLYGIYQTYDEKADIIQDYPSNVFKALKAGTVDIALVPVITLALLPNAYVAGRYGIATDGEVLMEEIDTVILDYQSKTSVALAQILLKKYWQKSVQIKEAQGPDFIKQIEGRTAAVIIGDRAMEANHHFPFVYDLGTAWTSWTGLPFVFAAWIATQPLDAAFIKSFDEANQMGLSNLEAVVAQFPYSHYDLKKYYTDNIKFDITPERRKGMELFIALVKEMGLNK
jgi:chorismate dehydratase